MNPYSLAQWIEAEPLPSAIRDSATAFPWIECVHVMSATFVYGMLIIIDLRLLGLASKNQPLSRLTARMVPWVWGGFCVSLVTGSLLFSQTASKYYLNTMFRTKMLLLLLAGLNMAVYHLCTARTVSRWDRALPPPAAVRVAGLTSLALWTGVIVVGRWIGFTLE